MRRAARRGMRVAMLAAIAGVVSCNGCPRHSGPYGGADFGVCQADSNWIDAPRMPDDVRRGLISLQCDFHQFSWRSFLYLMGAADAGVRPIDGWMPTRGIFVPSGHEPTRWGELPPPTPCGGDLPALRQAARTARYTGDFDDVTEPGGGDPLVDRNRRWVHFDVAVNEAQYAYLTDCELYRDACFQSVSHDVEFPIGSIEVKRSWRVVETCDLPDSPTPCKPEDASRFFTMRAIVDPYGPPLAPPTSGLGAGPPRCQEVTVALVGFHIAHRLPYRPAWIWSSFEHVDNAPLCDDETTAPPPGGWSFYAEACAGAECETNAYVDPCGSDHFDPACAKTPIATRVCRRAKHGGGGSASQRRIREVNASAHAMLSERPDWSLWANYELVGTLWKLEAYYYDMGASKLANTTLETYVQDTNCFSCHSREATHSSADFSHLFSRLRKGGAPCTAERPAYCPSPWAGR